MSLSTLSFVTARVHWRRRPRRGARRGAFPRLAATFGPVLVTAIGVSAAAAAPTRRPGPAADLSGAAEARVPDRSHAVCVAECPRDANPCDPADFKRADGRCDIGS